MLLLVIQPTGVMGQAVITREPVTLPEKEVYSGMSADDTAIEATGLPLPDLTVKDMCLDDRKTLAISRIGVLLANVGTADAGPFELGINYIDRNESSRFALDEIGGLKAGEETWVFESPICCGWAPKSLVYASVRFIAIADPRYYTSGIGVGQYEVKPKVAESNEKNNQMSTNKAELKPCMQINRIDKPGPSGLEVIKPRIPKP